MDSRTAPPEYHLELSADRSYVKDVVKGILHTIFFHRYFTPLYPATHDVLDMTLPYVTEDDVEALVEQRANAVLRQLEEGGSGSSASTSGTTSPISTYSQQPISSLSRGGTANNRVEIRVQFLERKRKRGWFGGDEKSMWECWVLDLQVMTARSEPEAQRNRRVMERSLAKAALAVVTLANLERGHIPPITTNDAPFPFQIDVGPGGGRSGGGRGY
ncbi:DUF1649-domain-containing protein [Dissoconium aciculare CBS 342.82]|uniref:Autophagy-related protein 101 n=1 Tax=Dissoconium aciculare CBS 342.82 TaxID=1314786 RepID=A0A6J3M3S6_9PEZI|nr:DUF1649-domain-containing protein [Dissoconium aciculare CBS 342.82]KAF1822686.1 DUF1649-domain-containing protein [Dissoconium aciculare CBS 342.82]